MKRFFAAALLLCLVTSTLTFGQANNGTLTGTVADATGAVLPGVTITATNSATGVVTSVITNEAGAYTIQSLLPGTYVLSAELPGFQKQTYQNVQLGNAVTVRLNFTLQVASQSQSVEVTIAADTILQTSSPTIGQTLTEKKVQDIPIVGNNVLDMLTLLGGLDNFVATGAPGASAFGREGTTLAGVSAQSVPTLRDGIMVQDQRWPTGINSATVINPDLVGEIRLIVSPVDAELGRGNGAIQIQTRSGTNTFRGAAVWNIQNTALNPNTWTNNRNGVPANWSNNNHGTISAGGPIVKNKTFFYALYDMNFNRGRANTYATVLTPCARNGVFRYFDNWNNGAYGTATTTTGANPTIAVVDVNGNPVRPAVNPNGTPYTGQLRAVSVFGPVTFPASGPNADCSNGTVNGSWDQFRTGFDTTGLIKRSIAFQPAPNDFSNTVNTATATNADGLNTAAFRYLRGFRGLDNLFSVGESTGNRKQINVKIDHNFNQKHRANINVSHEKVVSDDTVAGLPGTWSNQNFHRPTVITAGFVSTLSSSIVNEAKFGYRISGTNVIAPWDLAENQEGINKYLPPKVNGFLILPDIAGGVPVCSPITGARPPGNCLGGSAIGNNITATAQDRTPLWTYGDALSWTKGKHSYKFGGEIRFASSTSTGSSPGLNFFTNFKAPVVLVGGATPGSALLQAGPTAIANTNPAMTGIGTNDSTRARNLLNYLSGSLASVNNAYFLTDPKADKFSDYRTQSLITNTIKQREFDIFAKDDYKIRKNLTLNIGARYEWYGVPYSASGLTVSPVGGGAAAFGVSGRDFSSWMRPGGVDLTKATALEFVGPGSPNPGKSVYRNDWNNFGPAVGFAWQLPWFGEGKTTMRGGYQLTFDAGGRFNTLEGPLSNPPGKVFNGTYAGDSGTPYLDLSRVTTSIVPTPIPPGQKPMLPIPITDRNQMISFFDPNYITPYVQNMTLSITRSVSNNLTVDLRYVGTVSRKLFTSINLNSPNFLYNGLLTEFEKIRNGGESGMLDQMMTGINICATTCTGGVTYGAIGTTVNGVPQTAALQMRSSSQFQSQLANGYYANAPTGTTPLLTVLNTLNYVKTGTANTNLPNLDSTVRGAVLRFNGFPENLIATNPQFGTANYLSNMGNSNYHSLQAEVTLRPTHGFSGAANYTWSKNLGVMPSANVPFGPLGGFTNPVDRHADYTIVNNNHPHILRTNGTMELPIGPGKLLLGKSSGVLARAFERWQMGVIYTLSSGKWTSITAQNMLYANGVPDVVNADLVKKLLKDAHVRWGVPAGSGFLEGRYFDPDKWTKVTDPQCGLVTVAQNLNGLQTGTAPRCQLQAIAKIVPAGTAGSIPLNNGSGNSGLIVLQNPLPGRQGNLGRNILRDLPVFRFDANLSKAFKITETKSLQFRADVQNVLNHPQPADPSLTINTASTPWGQIGGNNPKTGTRTFQGQLRFMF